MLPLRIYFQRSTRTDTARTTSNHRDRDAPLYEELHRGYILYILNENLSLVCVVCATCLCVCVCVGRMSISFRSGYIDNVRHRHRICDMKRHHRLWKERHLDYEEIADIKFLIRMQLIAFWIGFRGLLSVVCWDNIFDKPEIIEIYIVLTWVLFLLSYVMVLGHLITRVSY